MSVDDRINTRRQSSCGRSRFVRLSHRLLLRTLEALLTAQVTAVVEHAVRVRVQRPVAALARSVGGPRDLDEAVVERQTVPDGVLPALLRLPVERELVHDELVDLAQCAHLERRRLQCHINTSTPSTIGRLKYYIAEQVCQKTCNFFPYEIILMKFG